MPYRLVVVPRWSGRPGDDWYPWLERTLVHHEPGSFEPVIVVNMPNPDSPTISAWVDRLGEVVGSDAEELERTVLVGHSVGAQAVIRYLEQLPEGVAVAGTLLVAGWLEVDQTWDAVRPWVETPIDSNRVSDATKKLVVLISDNDPFTSDYVANQKRWEDEFEATVYLESGVGHFNGSRQDVVIERLIADMSS